MTKIVVEQEWLSEATTPSGIQIRYGVKPKRVYQIRKGPKGRWKEVPSVTTVLDVLNKSALPWWGQRVGVDGVLTLFADGHLQAAMTEGGVRLACAGPAVVQNSIGDPLASVLVVADVPRVEELLKQHKLTVNHVRDAAGDRGQNVHDAFEAWAKEGTMPNPDLFPASEQGYVAGLRKFIEESGAVAVANEVMVGSCKWGYAGRYDVDIEYPEDVEIVVHHTPVRGEKRELLKAGVYTDDLKTSKGIYDSHFKQLAAYTEARIECGYAPTSGQGVIHVDANGNYKRVPSPATFAHFKTTLREWQAQQDLEKRRKESK